jgi:hypothetical protein
MWIHARLARLNVLPVEQRLTKTFFCGVIKLSLNSGVTEFRQWGVVDLAKLGGWSYSGG